MPGIPGPGNELPVSPILGTNVSTAGVTGQSNSGPGVLGQSLGLIPSTETGGPGHLPTGVFIPASDGVLGIGLNGVHGQSSSATNSGVWGENSAGGVGVSGTSASGDGVLGQGARNGVHGETGSATASGVLGQNTGAGVGVSGSGTSGTGISGTSVSGAGVSGSSTSGAGVSGTSTTGNAGEFTGNVTVSGNLTVNGDVELLNQDCAEDFEIAESGRDPGTVVVLDDAGVLKCCSKDYDKRVAGVVSGAAQFRPAIILGRQEQSQHRGPVALVGKVYCKVDATRSSIAVGDLLTTSDTPGHAMRANDREQAFGAVIGKALSALPSGRGLIPILVALQ
jgi:hypothetical protein